MTIAGTSGYAMTLSSKGVGAFDVTTGHTLWTDQINTQQIQTQITVGGGLAYFGDREGDLIAVDAQTGEPAWHTNITGSAPLAVAPTYYDNRLYVTDSSIQGVDVLDAQTGALLWTDQAFLYEPFAVQIVGSSVYQSGWGNPTMPNLAVFPVDGCGQALCSATQTAYIGPTTDPNTSDKWGLGQLVFDGSQLFTIVNGMLYVVNSSSFATLWTDKVPGYFEGADGGAPTITNDLYFVTTPTTLEAYLVSGCGSSDCIPYWSMNLAEQNSVLGPPISDGSNVYVDDSVAVYALGLPAAQTTSSSASSSTSTTTTSTPTVVPTAGTTPSTTSRPVPTECPFGASHLASGTPWAVAAMTDEIAGVACSGAWIVTRTGGVTSEGAAPWLGDVAKVNLKAPIVGIAAMPDGQGYWLVGADGGIFAFGDARFYGSTSATRLHSQIVSISATNDGNGYWFVASDGGVFSFGDAHFHGSAAGGRLAKPVVGMTATRNSGGYWLVAADGGIFSFGNAGFVGSLGNVHLAAPIVGMTPAIIRIGYRLVGSDGGVFDFGDARYFGSLPAQGVTHPDITTMAPSADGNGYYLISGTGTIWTFGDAPLLGIS